MIPLVVIKCRHRANTPFSFTRYVFKKLNVICIINVKVFIQIMNSPDRVRLPIGGERKGGTNTAIPHVVAREYRNTASKFSQIPKPQLQMGKS